MFSQWKKKKKKERRTRSLFSSLLKWMHGTEEKKTKETVETTSLVNIAGNSENVPSEFYKIVTASNMELSDYSQKMRNEEGNNVIKKRKEIRKRKKALVYYDQSISWSGEVKTNVDNCPAYLITEKHVIMHGTCISGNMTVVLPGYELSIVRVISHPYLPISLLTLNSSLPSSVETLCYPEEFLPYLMKTNIDMNSLKDWIEQAMDTNFL